MHYAFYTINICADYAFPMDA